MREPAAVAGSPVVMEVERVGRSKPTGRDEQRVVAAARPPDGGAPQLNLAFSCRKRSRSIAIKAVQTWVLTALGLVPTKVLILQSCLSDLKNNSTCQRSL